MTKHLLIALSVAGLFGLSILSPVLAFEGKHDDSMHISHEDSREVELRGRDMENEVEDLNDESREDHQL